MARTCGPRSDRSKLHQLDNEPVVFLLPQALDPELDHAVVAVLEALAEDGGEVQLQILFGLLHHYRQDFAAAIFVQGIADLDELGQLAGRRVGRLVKGGVGQRCAGVGNDFYEFLEGQFALTLTLSLWERKLYFLPTPQV